MVHSEVPRVAYEAPSPDQQSPQKDAVKKSQQEDDPSDRLNLEYKQILAKAEHATALHITTLVAMAEKSGTVNDYAKAEDVARMFLARHNREKEFLSDIVSHALAAVLARQGRYVEAFNLLSELDQYLKDQIDQTDEGQVKDWFRERKFANLPELERCVRELITVVPEGSEREGYQRFLLKLKE